MAAFINVSNRLPVTLGATLAKSSGGLVAALEELQSATPFTWIGWPGQAADDARPEEIEASLKKQFGYVPVFLSADEVAAYYHGFSNASLWPLLHSFPDRMRYEEKWWTAYREVNRRFADKIVAAAGKDETIWVHDYHLLLVPAEVRARRPDLRIGFFLHTPFPSSELFRCHPRRRELLEGLLGADQIGFHTYGYLRHFKSTLLRILGLESEMDYTAHAGRKVFTSVYPIGINADKFAAELARPGFQRLRNEVRGQYGNQRLVLSVERLDYTKGLDRRLQAIDLFLANCPEKGRVAFVLICVPSREEIPAYQELLATIESQVGQINGRHATVGHTPLHFLHRPIDFGELCALYSISEVMLVTSLRDGMNLVAKEYAACQMEEPGVLLLSEFAGAAEELVNALIVNPYNIEEVAGRLREALNMPAAERRFRMLQMQNRVRRFDARYWAERFLADLRARVLPPENAPAFAPAELKDIMARFAASRRRAIFLDYDGTLRELQRRPEAAAPTPEIAALLERLAADPANAVFLISGRQAADLDAWFGGLPIGLIAEHGYSFRDAGQKEWKVFDPEADLSWKPRILDVFFNYEGTTPGSWVEEKHASLVWHFRGTDPEFGLTKARQLVSDLSEMTHNLPVTVRHGNKIVEVCSIQADKAMAVKKFIQENSFDLVICAGDDQTDEAMFHVEAANLIGIKVGAGDTAARYRVSSPQAFRALVEKLLAAGPGFSAA
ncbi:MAG: bifunctional alpha,alpha-trehalose-phosphate synthase (UDP-forming)/trehalose-phosphatase [Kiritimatiellia bacterium]|jgi:trehalose 6-phosphate synthase/phosphatase